VTTRRKLRAWRVRRRRKYARRAHERRPRDGVIVCAALASLAVACQPDRPPVHHKAAAGCSRAVRAYEWENATVAIDIRRCGVVTNHSLPPWPPPQRRTPIIAAAKFRATFQFATSIMIFRSELFVLYDVQYKCIIILHYYYLLLFTIVIFRECVTYYT